MATVHIPSLLRELTQQAEEVEVDIPAGERLTVRELLARVDARYPGVTARLVDGESGELVPEFAVFIDGEPAGMGLLAKVAHEDAVYFLAPIVGGS